MDRFVNKKIERQTIYEIYRACRLCGAGGGYKMPIIQNIVNLDGCDVELRQKIRECVQIEVQQDDKMPPLICELCVDKVNDFYEFLEMCRQTNKRTRLRLGLPPQMMPLGAPDAGDCILGVTEPICVYDEDSNEPLSDKKTKVLKGGKIKKEPEKKDVKIVLTNNLGRESRSKRQPSPPRLRRGGRDKESDNVTLNKLQSKRKKSLSPPPKSILKKGQDKKTENSPPTLSRLKRSRERDTKPELPAKRVKISLKTLPPRQKSSPRLTSPKQESKPAKDAICSICKQRCKTPQALLAHMRTHTVTFTNPKLACNACGEWYRSADETAAHHRRHRSGLPYRCRRCVTAHRTLTAYDDHKCIPWDEVPDVECSECWRMFPTQNLLDDHRCPGPSGRPGGKCNKCGKKYASRKTLLNHSCKAPKKVNPQVDPDVMSRLKPIQVRLAKCDPLLRDQKRGHYDVSAVPLLYGLDKNCDYPYSRLRIKSEPTDCMVTINDMDFGSYVHWDSDDSGESDDDFMFTKTRPVRSLTSCALRTIFSSKFLGKVPRKYRRVKIEKMINSTLESLSDLCIDGDVNQSESVSEKLDKNRDNSDDKDEDDLFPKKGNVVTNNDFDSIFNSDDRMDTDEVGDRSQIDSLVDKLDKIVSENVDDSDDLVSKESTNECIDKHDENNDSVSNESKEKIVDESDSGSKEEKVSHIESSVRIDDSELEISLKSDTNNDKGNDNEKSQENNEQVQSGVENSLVKDTHADSDIGDAKNDQNQSEDSLTDNVTNENPKTIENISTEIGSKTTEEITNKESTESNLDTELTESNLEKESAESNLEKGSPESNLEKESSESNLDTDLTESNLNTKLTESNLGKESMESNLEKDSPEPILDNDSSESNLEKESSESNLVKNSSNNADKDSKDIKDNVSHELQNGDSNIEDSNLNMDDLEDFGSDSELEDSKLMAEIDAQIGEKKTDTDMKETEDEVKKDKINESEAKKDICVTESAEGKDKKDSVEQDKITLEDLLMKEGSKSMDLDSISDEEFNFDE